MSPFLSPTLTPSGGRVSTWVPRLGRGLVLLRCCEVRGQRGALQGGSDPRPPPTHRTGRATWSLGSQSMFLCSSETLQNHELQRHMPEKVLLGAHQQAQKILKTPFGAQQGIVPDASFRKLLCLQGRGVGPETGPASVVGGRGPGHGRQTRAHLTRTLWDSA